LLLALLLVKIPEAKGDLAQSLTLSDFKALLKEPYVIILMATNIFLSYPANVVFYYLSIYLSSIGFDHATIAIVYSLLGVASFLSGLIMIFLGKYFNLRQFVKLGTIGLIVALAPMITLWPLLLVPFGFFFGVSIDLVYGAFFPMTARLELNRSASLITLASLSASISSVLATLLNPFLYERIGFGGLLALSLFASAIAYLGITSIYRLKPEQL
jgi:predicted MFS family arabinose efflux permease